MCRCRQLFYEVVNFDELVKSDKKRYIDADILAEME